MAADDSSLVHSAAAADRSGSFGLLTVQLLLRARM